MFTFKVIDIKTGEEPDVEKICLAEKWANSLMYCDIEGFALTENGSLILADECGRFEYCPPNRFKVVFEDGKTISEFENDSWAAV